MIEKQVTPLEIAISDIFEKNEESLNPIATGTARYNIGQLFPNDNEYSWESENHYTKEALNTPMKILIEGSNGVSDYGNKIGEPVIQGYVRSFGSKLNIPSLLNKLI